MNQLKKYHTSVTKLVTSALKLLRQPKPSRGLSPIPASHKDPKSDATIFQTDEIFGSSTICKICQLEPVANFFRICYNCRQLEKANHGRHTRPAVKKYRFATRPRS